MDFPEKEYFTTTSVWNLNDAEFAISVDSAMNGSRSIRKYNVRTDTWTPFLSELELNACENEIEIDWNNRRVFASYMSAHRRYMIIFDMETKSVLHRIQIDMEFVKMVNVHGIMHCVGNKNASYYSTNRVWNEDELKWQEIKTNTIPNVGPILHLIHVSSKKILLLFAHDEIPHKKKTELWRYDIPSQKWEYVMNIRNQYYSDVFQISVILTTEEQFIIIKQQKNPRFEILDIRNENDYKLRQSKVRVPRKAFAGVLAQSHGTPGLKLSFTLTLGWTRRLKKLEKFTNTRMPVEIERMIAEWYSIEWIHWIMSDITKQKNSNLRNHQKIPLHDILYENM